MAVSFNERNIAFFSGHFLFEMKHIHYVCVCVRSFVYIFKVKDILLIASHKITEFNELSVLINFKGYFPLRGKVQRLNDEIEYMRLHRPKPKKNAAQQIKGYAILGCSSNEINLPLYSHAINFEMTLLSFVHIFQSCSVVCYSA